MHMHMVSGQEESSTAPELIKDFKGVVGALLHANRLARSEVGRATRSRHSMASMADVVQAVGTTSQLGGRFAAILSKEMVSE